MTLLRTRHGDYAAACALDFKRTSNFYDTFALRDIEGSAAATTYYPYFAAQKSLEALMKLETVPVKSCWNGVVAFDAAPFLDKERPLRFRGIPDSLAEKHLEASECCLIHADNPLSSQKGVWLNPNVRVGYSRAVFERVTASSGAAYPSKLQGWLGWLRMLKVRLLGPPRRSRKIGKRLDQWMGEGERNSEIGLDCLVDEMQILVDFGWMHM